MIQTNTNGKQNLSIYVILNTSLFWLAAPDDLIM